MKSFKSHLAEAASKFDLKKAYSAYNTLYFGGELPTDFPIGWYKSKKLGGEVCGTWGTGVCDLLKPYECSTGGHCKITDALKAHCGTNGFCQVHN